MSERIPLLTEIDALWLRRKLLDWRDKHTELVESHLHREIPILFSAIDKKLKNIPIKSLLVEQNAVIKNSLEPLYQEWTTREVKRIVDAAQLELLLICDQAPSFAHLNERLPKTKKADSLSDIAACAMASGAGIAAIPLFSSLATSSTAVGGFLGIGAVTVSTISWPIVITGIAVSSSLLAFGGYKASTFKKNAKDRLTANLHGVIFKEVFGTEKKQNSLCARLQESIEQEAQQAIQKYCV